MGAFYRLGWLVFSTRRVQRGHQPLGIGKAKEWAASHLFWRIYLISVKPKAAHLQPWWVKLLRRYTTMRRRYINSPNYWRNKRNALREG